MPPCSKQQKYLTVFLLLLSLLNQLVKLLWCWCIMGKRSNHWMNYAWADTVKRWQKVLTELRQRVSHPQKLLQNITVTECICKFASGKVLNAQCKKKCGVGNSMSQATLLFSQIFLLLQLSCWRSFAVTALRIAVLLDAAAAKMPWNAHLYVGTVKALVAQMQVHWSWKKKIWMMIWMQSNLYTCHNWQKILAQKKHWGVWVSTYDFDCWHWGPIKKIPTRGAAYLIRSRENELHEITPAYRTVIQAISYKKDAERVNGSIKRKRALCSTVKTTVLRS